MPLLSTLTEHFSGATIDRAKWPVVSDGVTLVEGRARVASTVDYNQIISAKSYTLQNSSVHVRVHPAAAGTATTEAWTQIVVRSATEGTDICFEHNALEGVIKFSARANYWEATATAIPYDPVAHRWWRIRASATQTFWDTSPDGVAWTNRRTVASPPWVAAENAGTNDVQLITHRDGGAAGYAEFDNVNHSPVAYGGATATFVGLTATAAGKREVRGSASPTFGGLSASAIGTRTATGQASASWSTTASTSGQRTVLGSASTAPSFAASASGTRETAGSAEAAFGWLSATASGVRVMEGSGSVTFGGLEASASGAREALGSASASWSFEATASSDSTQKGSASAVFGGLEASASGRVERLGSGTASWAFSAPGMGARDVVGSASVVLSFGASAWGESARSGSAVASFGFSASAYGVRAVRGSGSVSFAFSATAKAAGSNGPLPLKGHLFTVPYEDRMYVIAAEGRTVRV
ncbi:hypothetical protein [Actinocorallia libanotica]|uniref:Uncharacterized protein n=1 Tax=Actinocorallia libanotica TaxID=46162 RepID=A0ABN1QQ84_9ACTN